MKHKFQIFFILPFIFSIQSCSSYKKVPYLQTGEQSSREVNYTSLYKENIARFQPDDVIGITINTVEEKALASDFNLPFQPAATTDNIGDDIIAQGYGRQTYLIDKKGQNDFPVLGKITVQGYTQDELEEYLKKSIRNILKEEPIITIRLLNFKISVLGEVNRPGSYNVNKDHINVIQALALAGDMTIYGQRENVKILREMSSGEVQIAYVDVSQADVVSSPYFYLKQNDVVYIQPNKTRAKSSDIGSQTGTLISLGSMVLTLVNLIVLFAKN